jgi:hypothetical protein
LILEFYNIHDIDAQVNESITGLPDIGGVGVPITTTKLLEPERIQLNPGIIEPLPLLSTNSIVAP